MIRPGARVFDRADPRHVGIVYRVVRGGRGGAACVIWEETGWRSTVPLADLRRAPREGGPRRSPAFLMKRALAARAGRNFSTD